MIINITKLELWIRLGISEEERSNEQRILINLVIECEECGAHKTDDIADTVDYDKIVKQIKVIAKTDHNTLEKLGDEICRATLRNKRVKNVSAGLTKFVLPGTKSVSISIKHA